MRTLSLNIIRDSLKDQRKLVSVQAFWGEIDEKLERLYAAIDTSEFPSEVLVRHETRKLVGVTVATLPERYRTLLTAKYVDERSLESIARQTGSSIDGVKGQLRRARAAFRDTFLTLLEAQA